MSITLADVREAAERIRGEVVKTPCLVSRTLSEMAGCTVVLKFENLQFTASFKERGALNRMSRLTPAERAAGVLAISAGNHAQAVAYHAQRMDVPATIVMPRFASGVKVENTRRFGAEVVLDGDTFEDARRVGMRLLSERGLTLVHPYDDPAIAAGQGTVALEMLAQQPSIDTLVVPVGGGGLIAGMAVAARGVRPGIRIVGVQTERFPAVWNAVHDGRRDAGTVTMADGIAIGMPGAGNLALIRDLVDEVRLVDEGDIEQAVLTLLEIEKSVVEGAGAVGLAAVMCHPEAFAGRTVGVVLSGGNIEPLVLAEIIERGMVRSGRLTRLLVSVRDVPGRLAGVAELLGRMDANIDEVHHQRAFSDLSLERVQIEIVVQTRGPEHIDRIVRALRDEGYDATRLDGVPG
ncbi:MAG: threonine ammonia-lyase [Thermoleophilia bacterium]|nr:threonine ammonia-lyase [Thermoleophilia bacterium]